MILERGDMWDVFGRTDLFMITTNPIIRKDGGVVMGRGIALEAKKRFPSLPYDFARAINPKLCGGYQAVSPTGVIRHYKGQLVGFFMVKSHWNRPAELDIIEDSVTNLSEWAHHLGRVDLNFPGVGNGKLRREDVLPIIEQLPDNVHVWEEYGNA
jgi:hypothetical protein